MGEELLNVQHQRNENEHKLKSLKGGKEAINNELSAAQALNKELNETLKNLTKNLGEMTNKLEQTTKDSMSQIEKFKKYEVGTKKKINKLKKCIVTKSEEIKILTANIERKQSELESFKSNLDEIKIENEEFRKNKVKHEQYMAENELFKDELNAKFNDINKQNDDKKGEILKLTQKLNEENNKLETIRIHLKDIDKWTATKFNDLNK